MFITRSLNATPKTTEHNLGLVIRICKSETEVTNKKNCARGIVTVEANTDGHKASRGLSATAEHLV